MNKYDLGVDLSQHNGYVDFTKLKNAGCKYVILRLGWIGNKNNHTLDTYFKDYYKKAKEVGLPIGLYVYSYCKSVLAIDSACQWIEKQIQGLQFELPIFLDLEDSTIRECGKENLTKQGKYFCEYFKNRGYESGIYANKDWFTNLLNINELLNYKIWLAEWNNGIKPSVNFRVDLWQYSSKGNFDGILGNVDVNKILYDVKYDVKNVEKPVDNLKNEVYVEMKKYKNGSKIEKVFSDTRLSRMIGYLNPFEECDCLGIQNNLAIVKYKIDKTNDYKIGFVRWLGGIK